MTIKKATREHTKSHNRRLVLKTIYDRGEISRAEISRETHLARATVSAVVTGLLEEDLVEEVGTLPSSGGKPATLISVRDDSRCLIGVDLADNEFRGGVVDLRGRVLYRSRRRLERNSGSTALDQAFALIDDLVRHAFSPVLGIGVGVPGMVDTCLGVIIDTVHQDWDGLALQALLEDRLGIPAYIANDSHAAALGEFMFGEGGEAANRNLVVLRVGPGVSAGVILNGQLLFGDGFGAGEIGHVRAVEDGDRCLCGHIGCLETVVSRRTLLAKAQSVARTDVNSKLHQFVSSPAEIDSTDIVLKAFEAGDDAIRNVVWEMGRYLGLTVAHLVSILNIKRVLVAGSMSRFGETLLEPLRLELRACVHEKIASATEVQLASLGRNIVIQGAAALVLSYELGLA